VPPLLLAAPDKFRGTLTATDAAAAIAEGARGAGWLCDEAPLSDGGEGFVDVLATYGSLRHTTVLGPLGHPVGARWLLGEDHDGELGTTAIIEAAQAVGLVLAGGRAGNDPLAAGTAGVGQLVLAAVKAGARHIVVGTGGSASTDGGLSTVDLLAPPGRRGKAQLAGVQITVACDVQTLFVEAATVFAPQKGASPAQVELLRRRLEKLADHYLERFGVDVRDLAGSGSAGGLAGGLAVLGAELVPGFEFVAQRLGLAERVARADLVVTGEGHFDEQSFAGKATGGVIAMARGAGAPVLVVAGDGAPGLDFISLSERFGLARATSDTAACVTEVVRAQLALGPTG